MRGRLRCGWVALALAALCGCGGATTSTGASEAAGSPGSVPGDAQSVAADYFVSGFGVRIGIRVRFGGRRTVTGARLRWDDDSERVPLYPLDGTDPDRPPETVELAAGDAVLLEQSVVAACPGPTGTPTFEVASRGDDGERVDRFVPDAVDAYERAFGRWCDRPLTMILTGSSSTAAGDYEIYMRLSNPGPETAEVVSEAVGTGGASWERSVVVAPPGRLTSMTIRGSGPPTCDVDPPWALGRVLADGEPIRPSPDGDAWC